MAYMNMSLVEANDLDIEIAGRNVSLFNETSKCILTLTADISVVLQCNGLVLLLLTVSKLCIFF